MKKLLISVSLLGAVLAVSACVSIPKGAASVTGFQKELYLGKWYELARLDFSFEKNLNNTTAEYSLKDNGLIEVTNRGYNYETNKWSEAKGKARFRGMDTRGELEVSFFGPFYAGYNVIAIDKEYKYALVAGSSTKYLWILSRTKDIPSDIREQYLASAKSIGFDVEKLIWVEHNN